MLKDNKSDQSSKGSERLVASNSDKKICPVKTPHNYFQFPTIWFPHILPKMTPTWYKNNNASVRENNSFEILTAVYVQQVF